MPAKKVNYFTWFAEGGRGQKANLSHLCYLSRATPIFLQIS